MRADELIAALDLPTAARVDRRVPKKLLLENGAPTAADRRLIAESIESLVWVAALKPTTVGIPAFVDEIREYLEIAVISVTVRNTAQGRRGWRTSCTGRSRIPSCWSSTTNVRSACPPPTRGDRSARPGKVVLDDDDVLGFGR